MWGESLSDHEIVIDGCSFHVRDNLYKFLELASERYPNEPLWIDAVCINQSNNIEKAVEVRRMGAIYTGAKEVLIWLGNGHLSERSSDWINSVQREDCNPNVRKQLEDLLQHPYWTRTWVTQEVLLAKSIGMLCGTQHMEWTVFASAVIKAMDLDVFGFASALVFWRLWTRRQRTLSKDPSSAFHTVPTALYPFWSLFNWRITSQCTDPRDRIYGILALARDYPGFDVSYTERASDLFWRAGEHFNAWAMPYRILNLVDAVSLNIRTLAESAPAMISLPVSHAWSAPNTLLPGSISEHICKNKGCEGSISIQLESSQNILLCTRAQDAGDNMFADYTPCLHALLSPIHDHSADSYTVTLFDHQAQSRPLRLPWTSLQVYMAEEFGIPTWQRVKDLWPSRNSSGFTDITKERCKLQIPSTFVTEHLKSFLSAGRPSQGLPLTWNLKYTGDR
jgi:hypothetical protein